MRATQHNARTRANGEVFSPAHNDRKINLKNAPHIDEEKIGANLCFNIYDGIYRLNEPDKMSFKQVEQRYYEEKVSDHLNVQNERYEKARHKEKIKTMDEYRMSPNSCVEEVILQIGKHDESVSEDELWNIAAKQMEWEKETFPQVVVLDYTLHIDEPKCAPHIHVRRVWIATDKDGNKYVSERGALKEMGIKPPKEDHDTTRRNNAKVTYTKLCRDHFESLCKEHGIILEPRKDKSEVGLEHIEYKLREMEACAKAAEEKAQLAEERAGAAEEKIAELSEKNKELEKKLDRALEIVNNNKIAISPETKKNVRGVVTSIEDLTRQKTELEIKEKEIAERERAVKNKESKLDKLIKRLDPENIIQRIVEALKPIINIFAGDLYGKLRKFLQFKRQDKLLEEFDRKYIGETMKNAHIDVKKEIEEAVREAEDFEKDKSPFDRDER